MACKGVTLTVVLDDWPCLTEPRQQAKVQTGTEISGFVVVLVVEVG